MNKNKLVLGTAVFAFLVFFVVWSSIDRSPPVSPSITIVETEEASLEPEGNALIRPYSPALGPKNASVTVVEFFDPACEACRAMYPVVTELRKLYPKKVRIVMHYAAFHDGSDTAVRILETARLQGVSEPVLEASVG